MPEKPPGKKFHFDTLYAKIKHIVSNERFYRCQKKKYNLNTIYISERLQENLKPISQSAFTAVTAPMGYGKTTAINWYLDKQSKNGNSCVIRISIYSDNLSVFWQSVQKAFAFAGLDFLDNYSCPSDAASAGMLADELCYSLSGQISYYIFIDDFHLLGEPHVADFFCMLANRLPENIHLIVSGRNAFLSGKEILRLGKKLYQIHTRDLCLNRRELSVYTHRCGASLNEDQLNTLLYSSEGWFSAVYLNLCTFFESGHFPDHTSNIYDMFSSAMIAPLSHKQQEFLTVMGLADEFTVEMALFITGNPEAGQILSLMTRQNAFITPLPDGVSFRFHHMMKECTQRAFAMLSHEKQTDFRNRYGQWYENGMNPGDSSCRHLLPITRLLTMMQHLLLSKRMQESSWLLFRRKRFSHFLMPVQQKS